jgi:hypothetical protein
LLQAVAFEIPVYLFRGRQGQCVQAAVLQDIQPEASKANERVRLRVLSLDLSHEGELLQDPRDEVMLPLPPLWRRLAAGL